MQEQEDAAVRQATAKLNAGAPHRYFIAPGAEGEFCIIDEKPFYFRQEHALLNPTTKRYTNYVECIKEHEDCPACDAADKPSYFALFLTVIDLVPYTNDKGVTTDFSKKLLVAKSRQQASLFRKYEQYKTLRGMVIKTFRKDEKDAAIGSEFEFVEWFDEETLASYVYSYQSGQGRDQKTVNVDCSQTYDYQKIFVPVTARQLEVASGSRKGIGNREADRAELARPTATRRGPAPAADDWQPEEAAPATPPARRAAVAAPVAAPVEAAVEEVVDQTWMEEFDFANEAGEYCNEQGEYPPAEWLPPEERDVLEPEPEPVVAPAPVARPGVRRAVDTTPARPATSVPVEHTPEDDPNTPPFDPDPPAETAPASRRVASAPVARQPAPAVRRTAPVAAAPVVAPAAPARRAAPVAEPVQDDAPPPRRAAGRAMARGQ